MKKALDISIITFLIFTSQARATESLEVGYGSIKSKMSTLIKKQMARKNVVGLSIALVDGQKIVWAEGFGYSDKKKNIRATADTVYRVASVSKLFTDSAVMRLAERGKIGLDNPLKEYLPRFSIMPPERSSGITPRNLMTHHSGLPGNYLKGMWTRDPAPFAALPDLIKHEHSAYPPNYVFLYSNLGISLLGAAVQSAAGVDFAEHMQGELLSPMGMTRSAFASRLEPSATNSKGYRDGKETEDPPLRDIPAGGLNSSATDLSRFIEMIFAGGYSGGNKILDRASIREMLRPQNENVPLDFSFRVGLGWMLGGMGDIDIKNAGPVAHHSGATLLYNCQLIILPERELGVVVLANSDSSREVVDKVATEAIKAALEIKAGIRQPEAEKSPDTNGTLTEEDALKYAGDYSTILGYASISNKGGRLKTELAGRTIRLVPRGDGMLALRYKLFGLIPISLGMLEQAGLSRVDSDGTELLTVKLGGTEMLVGSKIRTRPTSPKWLGRLGRYELINADGDAPEFLPKNVRLVIQNGFLTVEYSTSFMHDVVVKMAVDPISDDEGIVFAAAGGEGSGERIFVETADGAEAFRFSGYTFRKK